MSSPLKAIGSVYVCVCMYVCVWERQQTPPDFPFYFWNWEALAHSSKGLPATGHAAIV